MDEIKDKKILYHMIISIESDLVEYLTDFVDQSDFTEKMIETIEKRNPSALTVRHSLQQLSFGDFIELINICKTKSGLTINELDFINKYCSDSIVQIRNRVMHPKPLEFSDYAIVENLFNKIDSYIHNIAWYNVLQARKDLKNNLDSILSQSMLERNFEILTNLPELNCEEIEFVGRKEEIGTIKKYLLNNKFNIVSIVASGGYGKTAITLKVLHDLIEDKKLPYELLIWVSFKTKQLDNTSFVEIENACTDIASMNTFLYDFIGESNGNIKTELIKLAQSFKTLLVLDNLETIDINEILPFLEEFISYGKVLITTRVGLGTIEKRYDLPPLNHNDVLEYTNSFLEYYNLDENYTNKEIVELAENILFSNPLDIKWAIRSLYRGLSLEDIKEERENVVQFCMSNVYENLSNLSQKILHLLSFNNKPITKGQIVYYLQFKPADFYQIEDAVNSLNKACFIDKKLQKEGLYSLTEQSKLFIDSIDINEGWRENFANKKRELNNIREEIDVVSEDDPYYIKAINIFSPTEDNIISAYYLSKAVELINKKENKKALEMIEIAENISPKFSECYKIHGLTLFYLNELSAKDMYEKAITYSTTTRESIIQYVAIANYFIRINDKISALGYIESAEIKDPNNFFVKMEKVKILIYMGKYNDAESIIDSIDVEKLKLKKDINLYYTRKADLIRRQAERLDERSQLDEKIKKLISAIMMLSEIKNPDDQLNSMLCKVISDLSYTRGFKTNLDFIYSILNDKIDSIKHLKDFKEMREKFKKPLQRLDVESRKKYTKLLFKDDIENLIDNDTIGKVIRVGENFGFIVNATHPEGIYFNKNIEVHRGDIVSFSLKQDFKGLKAYNLEIIDKEKFLKK